MTILLEDAGYGKVWIAWPLDDAAAQWLRETNVGAAQRWGDVIAIRWD